MRHTRRGMGFQPMLATRGLPWSRHFNLFFVISSCPFVGNTS
jgi:hypothetical protein